MYTPFIFVTRTNGEKTGKIFSVSDKMSTYSHINKNNIESIKRKNKAQVKSTKDQTDKSITF